MWNYLIPQDTWKGDAAKKAITEDEEALFDKNQSTLQVLWTALYRIIARMIKMLSIRLKMCFTFVLSFFPPPPPSVVAILSKQCCCQCLLCSLATIQSPPRSSQDCSLCSIIWRKSYCFIKDLSVSIQLTAMAGNVLWAVISTRVSAVTENKWDL